MTYSRFTGFTCRLVAPFAALCFAATVRAAADDAPPPGDTQLRAEVTVSAPLLHPNLRLVLAGDLRLARVSENRHLRGAAGLRYEHAVGELFTLIGRARFRATDEFDGSGEQERRLSLAGVFRFPLGQRGGRTAATLSDTNLLEWRFLPDGEERRYRNRLAVAWPGQVGRAPVEWYVSGEAYYEERERA